MEPEEEKLTWWERLAGVAFSLLLIACASPGARHIVVISMVLLVILAYHIARLFENKDR